MLKKTPRPPKPGYQRFRLLLAYDGTDYFGWQSLVHRKPTIQAVLEECLSSIFDEPISVIGSGRTDAGVHAEAQQAHFDAKADPNRIKRLYYALSRMTPPSIIIKALWLAPPDFHAIWSVEKKLYTYCIETGPQPGVFSYRYSTWIHHPMEVDKLNAYSQVLLGKHDFKSFMTGGSVVKSTIREVYSAEWQRVSDDKLHFKITGGGFLKQMVRNVVGTVVGLHKIQAPVHAMTDILAARDRQKALATAPARGLSLSKVFYPHELDIQCRKI